MRDQMKILKKQIQMFQNQKINHYGGEVLKQQIRKMIETEENRKF